jgi:D-lactate dehydrogenase
VSTHHPLEAPILPGLAESVAVSRRAIDRYAYSHDASHYQFVPDAVATPTNAAQVAALFRAAKANSRTLTFRSGGTSLSGQAGTSDIVVDTRHHFRTVSITPDGSLLTAGPGTTISRANASLRRLGRVLGPDPASDVACTIGGIVANNSSGMTCGTHANPYATLDSVIVVLPSGTILDTGAPKATEKLRRLEPGLYAGLASLRARARTDPQMAATIRRRFSMKNTMGYAVNALLDFEDPLDILAHLLVGSEGTLGFVSEARFRTLPIPAHVGTALLTFPTLAAATESLPTLVDSGLAVIELMDAASLRVAQGLAGTPDTIAGLHVEDHAALLVEHHADAADELAERMAALGALTADLRLATPIAIATDAAEKSRLWKVRKGLYASVAGSRPSGTTALLEDVCVPVDRLLATCEGLTELFAQHSYDSSVIFGHARDGNIHFLINERFSEPSSLARYEAFTADMVDLVLGQDGNLKAEHGTGRMMAPYVERQYGRDLYEVMREIKRLIDPDGLLSPGVVLPVEGASTVIDVRSLKLPVTVESEVDRCVECGFCEPGCPSKDITLTPRQRITLRRDMVSLRAAGDTAAADELERDYEYAGIDTCAVDGMCGLACPVSINTGDLTRRLRREKANPVLAATWGLAARAWGAGTRGGGFALRVADALPARVVTGITTVARKVVSTDVMPRYDGTLPGGGSPRVAGKVGAGTPQAVYVPACIQTMFGPESGGDGVMAAFRELCERAGVTVEVPKGIGSMCCGTPWKSKGYAAGYARVSDRTLPQLWEASGHGRVPVVVDAASCTEGYQVMLEQAATSYPGLAFVDATTYVAHHVLPALTVSRTLGSVAVHPTCSSAQIGSTDDLLALCDAIADEVVVPLDSGCCAFAGDRGMLHPELTASATAREAAEVIARDHDAYVSTNRTCELGMSRATGKPYRHVLELLAELTR